MIRKITNIVIWSLTVGYLLLSLSFTGSKLNNQVVKRIQVTVTDSNKLGFIDEETVISQLRQSGFRITGYPLDSIDRVAVKESVLELDAVKECQVFYTPDELLHIRINQKEPVVRIISSEGSYYLDEEGNPLDWSPRFTPRVFVVSGYTSREMSRKDLFRMTQAIHKDELLNSLIDHAYVHPDGEIDLVSRIGDQRIKMGTPERYEWKLKKLKVFFDKGLKYKGWDTYSSIDLRFSNQVVCSKK